MKNNIIFYTFLVLIALNPFQTNASDIVINDSKGSQSFTQNNQNLIITDSGHINGSVTSYLGSILTINASGTNGINSGSSTSIRNVDTINFNSGRIRSVNPFAIMNFNNSDFTINIGKSATLSGNNFAIFDNKNPDPNKSNFGKSFNITNDGIISATNPIIVGEKDLNLVNRGTITSNNNSSIITYLVVSNQNMTQNIVNESSGIMNGNIYTFAKDNALVTNKGVINGNIQVSGSNKSIQIINDGGLIGSSSSVKFISLNTGDKSSFKLINGTVNANMEVGLNNGYVETDNINLLGDKQVVDLKGGIYNGNIEFITGATINLGATDFKGTIKSRYVNGYSLDKGTINLVSTANLDSDVNLGGNSGVSYVLVKSDDNGNVADVTYSGAKIKSDYLNIEQGSRLNLDSDINIEGLISTNISGTLNFGYNSRSFVGNVISKGTGAIDLKSGNHNIIGDLTMNSGDILKVEVGSNSVGKLTVSGIANIPLGVKLDLNVTSASTLDKSYNTVIIDGNNGSSIKNIANNDISITSIDIGSYKIVKYNTSVSDDGTDLLLNVSSTSLEQSIENDPNNQFSSLKPQDNSSIKVNSLVTINTNNSLIEKRISVNHISSLKNYSAKKESNINQNKKYKLGFSTGDSERNLEVWTRVFGTKAKQKNTSDNGYNSSTTGFAIGIDKKISKDTMIGFTLSNANSKISTTNNIKITNVESYQVNFYASKFFDKYFFSAILGVALNKNDSNQLILDTSSIATAKYRSYNYVSKLGMGAIYKNVAKSGFDISPELSTTFVNTRTNSYSEKGADNFNLAVRKNYDEYLEARFGAEVSYKNIKMKNLSNLLGKRIYFTPKFNTSYGYNFLNKKQTTVSNFIGQSTTFNSVSTNINPTSVRIGTSLSLSNLDDVTMIFDYVNERRGGYVSHSAGFKISYQF